MAVEFAYAQARTQSRHGDRLTANEWRLLESSRGLPHYLHSIRSTELAPRVQHFSVSSSAHDIERWLRQDWRMEVSNASYWVPQSWRPAVHWTSWLPDLEAIGHLIDGNPVLPWMTVDPVLADFALEDRAARNSALAKSVPGLVSGSADVGGLSGAWMRHWESLWPAMDDVARAGFATLRAEMRRFWIRAGQAPSGRISGSAVRDDLEERVSRILRARASQPVIVFCHRVLAASELQRLRSGLIRRALVEDAARKGAK
jgi:hypothetical protein